MPRSLSIDLLRGFIMILMALDHASAMIARVHFTEVWGWPFGGYPNLAWWATRFVSHLCAPGFFFLMGMSIYLFASKRSQQSWSKAAIRNYFLKRGVFILLLMFLVEFPAWGLANFFSGPIEKAGGMPLPGAFSGGFLVPTTVLYGLGMAMIISSFLWSLRKEYLVLITLLSFAFSAWYISPLSPEAVLHPLEVLLFVPGLSAGAMSLYPVIPWLGVTTFGLFWAKLMEEKPLQIYSFSLYTGLAFLSVFLVFRFVEWGNFQQNGFQDWTSFFSLIKYPPSIVFFLFTLGINLILFYLFSKFAKFAKVSWLSPLQLFGQTAMFFYLLHLHLYALMGAAFPLGCSIGIMYLMWGLGLMLLYFACHWFLAFKQTKPADSWWRLV